MSLASATVGIVNSCSLHIGREMATKSPSLSISATHKDKNPARSDRVLSVGCCDVLAGKALCNNVAAEVICHNN